MMRSLIMLAREKSDPVAKAYKPDLQKISAGKSPGKIFNTIPSEIFEDSQSMINASKAGVPGAWLKGVIDAVGLRDVFVSAFNITSPNLSRMYRRATLDREDSEEFLDTVRLLKKSNEVWEDESLSLGWLDSPVPALGGQKPRELIDTFEGRRWVMKVLSKIEYGDFS
jgi:putative toxin-antitoxin system antitoxin component (TIGR02293 family)